MIVSTPRTISRYSDPSSGWLFHPEIDMALTRKAEAKKILLVDDNTDLLDMSADLLRMQGCEVVTATSGDAAIQILKEHLDFDAVVSDIVMPGKSGIDVGYEARKIIPGIKVILVSGFAPAALGGGRDFLTDFDCLSKPYGVTQLMKLIK